MDYAVHFADQAQRWHETDHGPERGRPLRRSRFVEPVEDPLADYEVPGSFRECRRCDPGTESQRYNPFWMRVLSWEDR